MPRPVEARVDDPDPELQDQGNLHVDVKDVAFAQAQVRIAQHHGFDLVLLTDKEGDLTVEFDIPE